MKIIYTIYLSQDGLFYKAFSNKKALFQAIENDADLKNYSDCRIINTYTRKNGELKSIPKPFNYSNLIKALSFSDEISIDNGEHYNSDVIRVQALQLLSK